MRYIICFLFLVIISCKEESVVKKGAIESVESVRVYEDSTSIRAIEVTKNELVFAGSNGVHGYFKLSSPESIGYPQIALKNSGVIDFLDKKPAFRAIAITQTHVFMLSTDKPALLYKVDKASQKIDLVYIEDVEGVFYNSMTFWNDKEGIAMGDPIDGCFSVIITRDGGNSWNKISCNSLPKATKGETAFAASDTNIAIVGSHTWVITGGEKSNILYSPNKGNTWSLFKTPIVGGLETTGGYSVDFYDAEMGVIYGGNYKSPKDNIANIAFTTDGGKQWQLVGDGVNQGYKSCVQFVPNSNGNELIALGRSGISYSSDRGVSWKEISKEAYLSFRFLNDSTAFASGNNKVDKLLFNRGEVLPL